jgi:hypothetical protein
MFDKVNDAITELREQSLAELPDALLEEDFASLQRLGEAIEAERLRPLAEIERRGLPARDGHLSAVSWLASIHGVARGEAAGQLRVARALAGRPRIRAALAAGDVSMSAARLLAQACSFDPEAFERSEGVLLEAATHHTVAELSRVLGFWRERVRAERLVADPLPDTRGLHASLTFGGMVRLDGDLSPECGEALLTALAAEMDAQARAGEEDRRTPAQRRHDALEQVCRGFLDRRDRPEVAGERPHLVVTIDVGELVRSGIGEADRVGPLAGETIRRLGCDASVGRIVLAGASEVLDIGRRTPVVPPSIRRALIARDRGCAFPGCDRHHAWCDAHHVRHWADGGPTALANLVLLCRRHHRSIHEAGFGVVMADGRAGFRRPDGSVLEDRAPPRRAA